MSVRDVQDLVEKAVDELEAVDVPTRGKEVAHTTGLDLSWQPNASVMIYNAG